MSVRLISACLAALAGALAFGWVWSLPEWGLVFGLMGWIFWDAWRAVCLLRWLRQGDFTREAPTLPGIWGYLVAWLRKTVDLSQREAQSWKQQHQAFLSAIQASPNGVVLLDPQGRIDWVNDTAAAHFGLDPLRDRGQFVGHLIRDPVLTQLFAEIGASRRVDASPAEVLCNGRPDVRLGAVRLAVQLHPYGEGRILMLSRDVTQREQAEAMRRDFVANVSHEIRTPLTVLAGFVETLQSLDLPREDQQRYLDLMGLQATRMQTLVGDLLTLSRLEGSPPPAFGDWHDVASLYARCAQEGRSLSADAAGRQRHELVFWPPPALLQLSGVQAELHSAMTNLVANAVAYTPDGGRIEISWVPLEDGRARFEVRDSGPGIAPEHLPRLTERFYRVDRSRSRETGGTGLGLAIVKHVMQRHGGELVIDSRVGHGSTFALVFPASRLRQIA